MQKHIIPIRAFKDNYIWMFVDPSGSSAWVVDPGDAEPVIQALKHHQCDLAGILLTHHHTDHSGGIEELLNYAKNEVQIAASAKNKSAYVNKPVQENDRIICNDIQLNVLEIPGHTLDHTAFYNESILFCGDTLFSAGCGKIFEGTPAMMYASLQKIAALSPNVNIYCGHEYTLDNLFFAEIVDPNNFNIRSKIEYIQQLGKNACTLPAKLAEEKLINPFLRCHEKNIIQSTAKKFNKHSEDPVEIFGYLREWKNNFRR